MAQGKGRPSSDPLTIASLLWQEKEKEKEKVKEKEKDSKEKEKDKKLLNGHSFSAIPVVGPISCSQCAKSFTSKDAYTCASKTRFLRPLRSRFLPPYPCLPPFCGEVALSDPAANTTQEGDSRCRA